MYSASGESSMFVIDQIELSSSRTQSCLQRMQPSTCPLCRKAFLPDRVKKLHIDKPTEHADHDDSARVNEFMQRLDSASTHSTQEEVIQLVNEVQHWLNTRDDRNHIVVCLKSCATSSWTYNNVLLVTKSIDLCAWQHRPYRDTRTRMSDFVNIFISKMKTYGRPALLR